MANGLASELFANRRAAARERTARRAARQASSRRTQRTARRKARQEQRTARAQGRQATRQMKIQAKGQSGYWSPDAVQARSMALGSSVDSATGAAANIFGSGEQVATGTSDKAPVPYPLIVGLVAAGVVVYLYTANQGKK